MAAAPRWTMTAAQIDDPVGVGRGLLATVLSGLATRSADAGFPAAP